MQRYQRGIAAFIGFGLAVSGAFGLDWPADAGLFRYGFGSQRQGFLKGIEFGLTDSVVRATADGEPIFLATGRLPGGFPVPGGAMLVVAHNSSMISIYTGLDPGPDAGQRSRVVVGDILGFSRPAGSGLGMSYYFYDARTQRFLNPVIALPTLPDDRPPVFRSAILRGVGGEIPLEQNRIIRQGSYELILDLVDTTSAGGVSPPHEIRVTIDGLERVRQVYDGAWADSGRSLLFTSGQVAEAYYLLDDGRIRLGPFQFSRGRTVISLAAFDYARNRRELTYSLQIQ